MASREEKDCLASLRKLYIEKLDQLKIKLNELDRPTKSVHFNSNIENIDTGWGISRSPLSPEEERGPSPCRCAYDRVECILDHNTWQFKRKER